MPFLALDGTESFGRRRPVIESFARVAENVEGGVVEEATHWVPEEKPEELLRRLITFFGRH